MNMNEPNFINYDGYFCNTNYQASSMDNALADYDVPSQGHYLNCSPCDLVTLSSSSVDQRHVGQTNLFQYLSHSREEQDIIKDKNGSTVLQNSSFNNNNNIPFVQIHTTDVQPPHRSYGNVFRRNVSRQDEIKSEPIKSESAETLKDRINATPTPPRIPSATQQSTNEDSGELDDDQNNRIKDLSSTRENSDKCEHEDILEKQKKAVYKCSTCPYMTLRETDRNSHEKLHRNGNARQLNELRTQIKCPGCKNIFYAQESLEIHLKLDHLMTESDISKLIGYIGKTNSTTTLSPTKDSVNRDVNMEPPRKSRIYLKNVECLREPNRQPIEQTENHLTTAISNNNNNVVDLNQNLKPPKQKISIKSVDVLREPALLRKGFEIENVSYSSYNTDNQIGQLNTSSSTPVSYNNISNANTRCSDGMAMSNVESSSSELIEKSRKPKIYVKSVESFNLMPLNALQSANGDFMGCSTSMQNYDTNVANMTYIFEANTHTASSSNAMYSNDHHTDTTYQLVGDSAPTTHGYTLDNSFYMNNVVAENIPASYNESMTYTTESTSPPDMPLPPSVVNVTDLNSFTNKTLPNSQEHQRGTLHLRTVDELNLLVDELNEVQHLIAPNLDNSQNSETISTTININGESNLIGDAIYETETFKFQDLDSQMANDWPETYEDLAEDINGIITDVAYNTDKESNENHIEESNPKDSSNVDIETPQVSLITIRDIEELTGVSGMNESQSLTHYVNDNNGDELHTGTSFANNLSSEEVRHSGNIENESMNVKLGTVSNNENADSLKRELSNATPETKDTSTINNQCLSNERFPNEDTDDNTLLSSVDDLRSPEQQANINSLTEANHFGSNNDNENIHMEDGGKNRQTISRNMDMEKEQTNQSVEQQISQLDNLDNKYTNANPELPPLVPVTNFTSHSLDSDETEPYDIPETMLVPIPPLIKINKTLAKEPPITQDSKKQEDTPVFHKKGRIYVANNLMEPVKPVSITSGTSIRGRPFGGRRITPLQNQGITPEDSFVKCSVKGCVFRFKKPETLEYHRKCHDSSSSSANSHSQATICPECRSTEFNNWNTLHTHLWRAHQIDMELYKCELCDFRTPIFSRLFNTHARIHSDLRSYKCEQCGKGFKNSKQLKNHRRWHRVQSKNVVNTRTDPETLPQIHRCAECGSTFKNYKTLKEHSTYCKNGESSLKCDICQKTMSTKASLKLHLLTHSDSEKRFKCQHCDYATNDHNAFRRHRMGHENKKMYDCPFCDYKSVQSVTYQKHVRHKHPDKADSVLHKCTDCQFTTINRTLLVVHQAKHHKAIMTKNIPKENSSDGNYIAKENVDVQKSKIKVKSNLFTL
ncbi:uncharacterized protein LOC142233464 [Haematobia irritans]|uniref:uncharacterized protein LOC142233464 n=1 Tax=Haematobia irritans TaxID=7368 RepID=UPI003F50C805